MESVSPSDWKRPYRYMVAAYFALILVAGSIVVWFQWPFWSEYARVAGFNRLLLSAIAVYFSLDLIRIPLATGSTISVSFPVLVTALLVSAVPAIPIPIAMVGSLLGELVYSCVYRRLRLGPALMRAVLYACHHAVACCAAAIAFVLFPSPDSVLDLGIKHSTAILSYVLVYGIVSTLVVRPHDWWVDHLLVTEEERLPRVEMISAIVVMTPIPIILDNLYGVAEGPARLLVYYLPLLFLALLLLARSFAKAEVENSKGRDRERAKAHIGSPPNLAELTQNVLDGASRLVNHQWAALYSTEVERESCRLLGQRHADGPVEVYGLWGHKEPKSGAEPSDVKWPDSIEWGKGVLGDVVCEDVPHAAFEWGGQAVEGELCLPSRTALLALPVRTSEGAVVGLLALARPRRLFTRIERDRALALAGVLGDTLHSVQGLESRLQQLYEEIEQYAQPEPVELALDELIRAGVDVPGVMAAVSAQVFRNHLRAVVRSLITGPSKGNHLTLQPDELEEIYKDVQGEMRDMPPWSPEILEKLQAVISGLAFAFSFRYQWPEVAQDPDYAELYQVLAKALDARTVPDVVAQGSVIKCTIERLMCSSLVARERICRQLQRLQEIIELLRAAEEADAGTRVAYLSDALQQLHATEEAAESELEDPERFTLVKTAATWQEVVTNALYAAREGGARLAMALGSQQALPLDEITVQLLLENRGPGLASGVVVGIRPSEDYQIEGGGRVELGALPAGESRGVDFRIRPRRGRDELHLSFEVAYRDRERREKREPFADRVRLREALVPFVEIDNPYVAGKALRRGSPLFFGREDVFEFIQRSVGGAARGKHMLLLVGERRTGKTSILKQLPERLKGEPYVHAFFDCQGLTGTGIANFLLDLSNAIAHGLRDSGLLVEGLSPAELMDHPRFAFEEEFLPRVWGRIGDRSLLLAIDEFDVLERRVQEGKLDPIVFPYLRSLMQAQGRIAFIFVGAHRLEELASEYWSVLFNIVKMRRISFLDQESAVRLITEPVRQYGVVYDDLALEEVLRLTAGHPYFLQLVCDALMEHCNDVRRNYVTIQDVRDVGDEITVQGRAYLLFVWGQSSWEERAVLAALASLLRLQQRVTAGNIVGCLAECVGGLVDRTPFDLRAVEGALERLMSREIVREAPDDPPTYTFTAGLYGDLIARYKSLHRVAPELVEEALE